MCATRLWRYRLISRDAEDCFSHIHSPIMLSSPGAYIADALLSDKRGYLEFA